MNKNEPAFNSVCSLFRQTDRMHRNLFEKATAKAFGIHRSQHMVLMCISQNNQVSQNEIAQLMKISPAAASVTVKKLEFGDYIERRTGNNDSRKNIVVLTEKGKTVVDKTHKIFCEIDNKMIEGVSQRELEIFGTCLERMQKNLEEYNAVMKNSEVLI